MLKVNRYVPLVKNESPKFKSEALEAHKLWLAQQQMYGTFVEDKAPPFEKETLKVNDLKVTASKFIENEIYVKSLLNYEKLK